jgi:type IV pilus assembly protein PilA
MSHRGRWVRDDDGGFTLIELMVVVLIIGVLIGIGIPMFMGARERANDRATAANVRNAFTAARIYYTDKQVFTADTGEMSGLEPSLRWTNTPLDGSETPSTVYVETQNYPAAGQTVVVVGRSRSGRCYYLRDVMAGTTTGTHYQATVPAGATCSVPLITDPDWKDNWAK